MDSIKYSEFRLDQQDYQDNNYRRRGVLFVMPAEAGIQSHRHRFFWIPKYPVNPVDPVKKKQTNPIIPTASSFER